TAAPSVHRSGNPAVPGESAPRSDAPCAVACVALFDPPLESRPRNRRPPPFSSVAVPFSCAVSAEHCRLPPEPSVDARPISWPRPRLFPRRTHTLGGSAQTAPLWLSSPTSLLRSG